MILCVIAGRITAMLPVVDAWAEEPTIPVVAGVFVSLAVVAWLASTPGISLALIYYGALLASGHLYRRWRSSTTRLRRSAGLFGLALTWLGVLAFSAAVLPSNFSAPLM
jgi:hypothetical protein